MDKIKKTYLLCLKQVQNANVPQIQALIKKTECETAIMDDMSQSSMDNSSYDAQREPSMSNSVSDMYPRTQQYNKFMELPVCHYAHARFVLNLS